MKRRFAEVCKFEKQGDQKYLLRNSEGMERWAMAGGLSHLRDGGLNL